MSEDTLTTRHRLLMAAVVNLSPLDYMFLLHKSGEILEAKFNMLQTNLNAYKSLNLSKNLRFSFLYTVLNDIRTPMVFRKIYSVAAEYAEPAERAVMLKTLSDAWSHEEGVPESLTRQQVETLENIRRGISAEDEQRRRVLDAYRDRISTMYVSKQDYSCLLYTSRCV